MKSIFRSVLVLLTFTAAASAQIGVFGGVQGGMNATRSGTGAPADSLGVNGDLYIDTTAGSPRLYGPKASGHWPTGIALGGSGSTLCNAASSSSLGCLIVPPNSGLTVDANGHVSVTAGAFLGDPGSNGLLTRTAAGATAVAKAGDLPTGYPYASLANAPTLGSAAGLAASSLLSDSGANGLIKRTGQGTTAAASAGDLPTGYPYANLANAPVIGSAAGLAASSLLSDSGANGLIKRTGQGTTAVALAGDLPTGYPYASLANAPAIGSAAGLSASSLLSDSGANGLIKRTGQGTTAVAAAGDLPVGYPYASLANAPAIGSAAALSANSLLSDSGANGLIKRTGQGTTAVAAAGDLPAGYPYASLTNAPAIPSDVSALTDSNAKFIASATATPASSLMTISNGGLMVDRSDPAMAAFNVCFHNYTTRYCNVALIGDSWTEGGGSGASASNYWAVQLQKYLQANSFYHGAGIIPIHTSSGAWAWGGSTYSSTNLPPTVNALGPNQTVGGSTANTFGTLYQLSGTANTVTLGTYNYTTNSTGTRFYADTYVIYYATSTDTAAGFTVTISNTSSSGVVTSSTAVTCGATTTASYTPGVCTIPAPTVGGTALNWDTLTITPPATGNAYIYGVEPVAVNNPVAPLALNGYTNVGVSVYNFARGGANSNAFGSSTAMQLAFLPQVYGGQVQLAIISLGLNDWGQSISTSTYQTNLQNIVSYLQAHFSGISILILDQGNADTSRYTNGNGNTQADFRAIEKKVANTYGCAYLSIGERWGTFPNANTNLQVMNPDGLHPNDAGYIDIAQMIERRIVEQTLAFTQLYPGQTEISGNQTHNANFETSSTYLGQNAGGSGNSGSTGFNTGIGQNACSNITTGHNNLCIGQYTPGPTTGSNDSLVGSNAKVGNAVNGSFQLGMGINNTSNTGQFQGWNFIDAYGYVYARALMLGTSTAASASSVGLTYGINHLTGTISVSTMTLPTSAATGGGAAGSAFTGCLKIIADSGFTTGTSGNIFAAYTLAAGKMYEACYDGSKWYFSGSGI